MAKYALALLLAALPLAAFADLGINLYGLSYHFDRARAEELGLDNPITFRGTEAKEFPIIRGSAVPSRNWCVVPAYFG
jgi:hypothetical protein